MPAIAPMPMPSPRLTAVRLEPAAIACSTTICCGVGSRWSPDAAADRPAAGCRPRSGGSRLLRGRCRCGSRRRLLWPQQTGGWARAALHQSAAKPVAGDVWQVTQSSPCAYGPAWPPSCTCSRWQDVHSAWSSSRRFCVWERWQPMHCTSAWAWGGCCQSCEGLRVAVAADRRVDARAASGRFRGGLPHRRRDRPRRSRRRARKCRWSG